MSKIKILHVGKYYSPFKGGIENFLKDLLECEALGKSCHSRVLAHHHDRNSPSVTESIGGISVRKVKLWWKLLYAPICPTFHSELANEIREFSPDVLHIHMPNLSAFLCLFCKEARRLPWIIHWHSDVLGTEQDWRIKLLYPLYRVFEKKLLQTASSIVCTSPNYLHSSKALKGFNHKCTVIPLGVRLDERETQITPLATGLDESSGEARIAKDSDTQPLKLLCVGRLSYYKGHKYLLDAVARLNNVQLTIIGKGEMRNDIEARIARNSLTKRVTLKGEVNDDELSDQIRAADLICLASIERTEAFGLVTLEAARSKKPALVTNVVGSGMSWVVVDKSTGWVVPAKDTDALAQCIKNIQHDRSTVVTFGEAAYNRLTKHFQINAVGEEIAALYENTL